MADELDDVIREAAAEPAAATTDGGSISQRPLSELIEADKYLAAKRAARLPRRGIRLTKIVTRGPGD